MRQHHEVYEAIEARRPEHARRRMREHLQRVWRDVEIAASQGAPATGRAPAGRGGEPVGVRTEEGG
jgi:DNA-binding GntR family transcriptional regulator